jgi:hypothetical protein
VNRQRVGLVFSGEAVPEAGTPLMMEGKEVGFLTRVAKAWDCVPARVLGMGYVRREAGGLGTVLQWANGTATVTQLPV